SDAQRGLRSAESEASRARASLAEARAQLGASRASATRAGETVRTGERGVELGLTARETARQSEHDRAMAEADVTLRRAQLESARAQVASADLSVEEARRNLDWTEIRAPFAGTILSVSVERGAIVSSPMGNVSGGTTLMTLADLTDLRVIGQLDESQVGRVEVGQPVRFRVDAYPEREFTGAVHRVSPLGVVDTNVVVFDVEIVVNDPNASLLRSGMSADVEIVTREHRDVVVIPVTAIRSSGSTREVTLASGARRPVRTAANDGEHIVVLEGLNVGDEILRDGRSASSAPAPSARSGLLPGPPGRGPR
ncbi:MAG: efflux RND transporter periplasmic adaptor subunit, partial [Myxococcales bacterium]|nr:efflux RND transporter periplasmic adaptor subunit [Myxococcales bacterium]